MSETSDIARVRAEIAAEVRARRAAGEYPAGFERELDVLFARFAPSEIAEDLHEALERAEDAAGIDPEIPVASNSVAFGLVKRALAKVLGWYHVFVAQQVTALGVAANNVLRRLVEKVSALEVLTGHADQVRNEGARLVPVRDDATWQAAVLDAVSTVRGRALVAECGTGELLSAVAALGIDVYGVEPRPALLDDALARGLDARLDDVAGHLRAVGDGELDALVLRACTERASAGELLELADLAARALAPDGRLVVCSATPAAWGRGRTVVEADLAPGRPLHADTWTRVLADRGITTDTVHVIGGEPLAPVGDATLDANLARISDTLFGPEAYVLVATRAS